MTKNKKEKMISKVLLLLRECFYVNKKAYNIQSKKLYERKEKLLLDILNLIKKYQLPIKYGSNRDSTTGSYGMHCLYFCYAGRQMSFHTLYRMTRKSYNGKRKGRRTNLSAF